MMVDFFSFPVLFVHEGVTAIKTHVPPKGNMFVMLVNNLEKYFPLVVKSSPVCSASRAKTNYCWPELLCLLKRILVSPF